jgi:tRNA G10  N-methylase Trm11
VTFNYGFLSLLELVSYLSDKNKELEVFDFTEDFCIFNTNEDISKLVDELGGTTKVGEVINEVNKLSKLKIGILSSLKNRYLIDDKGFWAVSVYSLDKEESYEVRERAERACKAYINELRAKKVKLVRTNRPFLLSNESKKIIERGFELIVCLGSKIYIGLTSHIIDDLAYKERDLKRPFKQSMLSMPPKLARIMVNLSNVKDGKSLLDPFCGTGTILQEALLKGANVVGVDINNKNVNGCRENIEWICKRYKITKNWKVIKGDARMLSKILSKRFDCIVSEPFLIPALKSEPTEAKAKEMLGKAKYVYYEFLSQAFKLLKRDGRLVISQPMIRCRGNRLLSFSFVKYALNIGFKPFEPFKIRYPIVVRGSTRWVERGISVFVK